jgi:hypothetical protein
VGGKDEGSQPFACVRISLLALLPLLQNMTAYEKLKMEMDEARKRLAEMKAKGETPAKKQVCFLLLFPSSYLNLCGTLFGIVIIRSNFCCTFVDGAAEDRTGAC